MDSSTPRAPPTIAELPRMSPEKLPVNLVQNPVVLLELPGERAVAQVHSFEIFEAEGLGVLFGRDVPRNVVKIMVNGGVLVVPGVADDGLEVSLRRRDEVGVVEKEGSREVVPAKYAVLCK